MLIMYKFHQHCRQLRATTHKSIKVESLVFRVFQQRDRCKILLDQLQSEQGARFLQKEIEIS